ncbi:hypothetical protein KFE25_005302 [Diacronema lutheri]|uniref:Uncharacterized protein n=1 Tax=Diacronema lutheri TaxID=2081491 RepID=A0A8J5XJW9_DIALT|nr:hypothetical protein KFE25_005302 [Diacronema lutheri]
MGSIAARALAVEDAKAFARALAVALAAYVAHAWGAHRARCSVGLTADCARASQPAVQAFLTLISLFHSLILCQTYAYYFDRAGKIQECLFRELAVMQRFLDSCKLACADVGPAVVQLVCEAAHAYGHDLVGSLNEGARLLDAQRSGSRQGLYRVVDALGHAREELPEAARGTMLLHVEKALDAVHELGTARAERISHITAQLPMPHWWMLRIVALLTIFSFLLIELGCAQLDAAIFATVCGATLLVDHVIVDLADPFTGAWSVQPAVEAATAFLEALTDHKGAYVLVTFSAKRGAGLLAARAAAAAAAEQSAAEALRRAGTSGTDLKLASGFTLPFPFTLPTLGRRRKGEHGHSN